MLVTSSQAPVNITPGKGRLTTLPISNLPTDRCRLICWRNPHWVPKPKPSKTFNLCLVWLEKHNVFPFGGQRTKISRSDSLAWLGIRGWYPAYHGIPRFAFGFDVHSYIDQYLRQTNPPALNFLRSWKITSRPKFTHPDALEITFEQLVRNIRSHVR